jgi:hypothetical protein
MGEGFFVPLVGMSSFLLFQPKPSDSGPPRLNSLVWFSGEARRVFLCAAGREIA